jgi:hypothetical protein
MVGLPELMFTLMAAKEIIGKNNAVIIVSKTFFKFIISSNNNLIERLIPLLKRGSQ